MKKIFILVLVAVLSLNATERDKDKNGRAKKDIIKGQFLHANNVKAMVANNGWLFWGGGPSGFIIPSPVFSTNDGNYATVYASGLWLSGKVEGKVRTSIAYYVSDMTPGLWQDYKDDPTGVGSQDNDEYTIYYYYSASHIAYLQGLLNSPDPTPSQKIHKFASDELAVAADANQRWADIAVAKQGAPAEPPGHLAAFTVYHDSQIATRRTASGKDKPLNVQVRMLAWAFRQAGPINNAVFVKFEFINKNTVPITDLYATAWADPDLGDYGDDLVGSDKSLGLGYCYNGKAADAQYTNVLGIAPPAVGYDYFQGPIVDSVGHRIVQRGSKEFKVYVNKDDDLVDDPSDVVIEDKYVRPASSFYYYNNGDEPISAVGWNNFMKALDEDGGQNSAQLKAIADGSTTIENSKFFFNGDPAANKGWLDEGPSDRRFILNNGPFQLGVSDGTEKFGDPGYNSTVFGVFTSFGSSALNSVTQLKIDDRIIQNAFNSAFELTPNPPAPVVTVLPENQKLSFTWVQGSVTYKGNPVYTESYNLDGYKFQGYEIVQFESANTAGTENYKLLATYDLVDGVTTVVDKKYDSAIGDTVVTVVLIAQDLGVLNNIKISRDEYSTAQAPVLRNYSPYSFGIRAIAYNSNPDGDAATKGASKIKKGEWAVGLINLVPKRPEIGSTYFYNIGDYAEAERVGPASAGGINAKIVNPELLKNATYTGKFYAFDHDIRRVGVPGGVLKAGELLWRIDQTINDVTTTIVRDMPQSFGEEVYEDNVYSIELDGILWSAYGPTLDITNFSVIKNADGDVDPPEMGTFGFNGNGFPLLDGSDRPDEDYQQTNGSTWGLQQGKDATKSSYSFYVDESIVKQGGWSKLIPHDFEIRFTNEGKGFDTKHSVLVDIPFEVWNLSLGVKLIVEFVDANDNGKFDLKKADHSVSGGSDDPYTETFFVFNPTNMAAGSAGYNAWVTGNGGTGKGDKILGYQVFVNWNGGSVNDPEFPENLDATMPETGTVFKIVTNKANLDIISDVFTINKSTLQDADLAQSRFSDKVNVWPNPYRGWHDLQDNSGGFVEFINLPTVRDNDPVRVKIFNLSGSLVRDLSYTGQSNTLRWQLDNNSNVKVATGIYIAYLKYRNSHKVIKIAVNIGENRPKTF